ncbi:hypothetical protein MCHI_001340 [Candidatus Magnetoovum chiemensis]|nr:hypothetical protein MCHI_001340 [Candidatus Magnetoovum chiemensis]
MKREEAKELLQNLGARCCTSTKAMQGSTSAGMPEKKASNAANPPADAPMPTMGKWLSVGLSCPLAGGIQLSSV